MATVLEKSIPEATDRKVQTGSNVCQRPTIVCRAEPRRSAPPPMRMQDSVRSPELTRRWSTRWGNKRGL